MSKECPYCKLPVPDEAKKCPNCHEWVKPWAKGGHNWRTVTSLTVIGIPFLIFYYFTSQLNNKFKDNISEHPVGKIISSQVTTADSGSISIIGELKNENTTEISGMQVEASYYDNNNKLINTGSDYILGYFAPGEVRPFKITFGCKEQKIDRSQYDHFKLTVH